jgi:hypothetical protein
MIIFTARFVGGLCHAGARHTRAPFLAAALVSPGEPVCARATCQRSRSLSRIVVLCGNQPTTKPLLDVRSLSWAVLEEDREEYDIPPRRISFLRGMSSPSVPPWLTCSHDSRVSPPGAASQAWEPRENFWPHLCGVYLWFVRSSQFRVN